MYGHKTGFTTFIWSWGATIRLPGGWGGGAGFSVWPEYFFCHFQGQNIFYEWIVSLTWLYLGTDPLCLEYQFQRVGATFLVCGKQVQGAHVQSSLFIFEIVYINYLIICTCIIYAILNMSPARYQKY